MSVNATTSSNSGSDDNSAVNITLATSVAIAVIGLVISVMINFFVIVKHKQSRYVAPNIHYSYIVIADCLL